MKRKCVLIEYGVTKKRDNLLKVHNDTVGNIKKNVMQKAKKEHKTELLLKKEDIQPKNIRVDNRIRKPNPNLFNFIFVLELSVFYSNNKRVENHYYFWYCIE